MTDKPKPTDEQAQIISMVKEGHRNVLANSLAGTGKTQTLVYMAEASREKPILCLAFNNAVVDEMTERLPSDVTCRTINSQGHRVWGKTVANINVDRKKISDLFKAAASEYKGEDRAELSNNYWEIISAVGKAKNLGYIPNGKFPHAKRLIDREDFHAALDEKPSEIVADCIDDILFASIKAAYAGNVDFDDQVYMPALFGGSFPRFPLVLLDEGQDMSPVNHVLLGKLVSHRLGAVGDKWQAIYAFRGADTESMPKLQKRFDMEEADLTVSFRCPEEIVKAVHWRVPKMRWLKAGGIVGEVRNPTLASFPEGCTIICRNNAPLFHLAFRLLSARRSVTVAGSELGPKLVRIMQKICNEYDRQEDVLAKIEGWRQEKLVTSQVPKTINDTADCMKVFATFGETLTQAVAYADHLFKQKGTIRLTTGHKAKGLEWDTVYHLDDWLLGTGDQELNLKYVISTRAKQALYRIESPWIT